MRGAAVFREILTDGGWFLREDVFLSDPGTDAADDAAGERGVVVGDGVSLRGRRDERQPVVGQAGSAAEILADAADRGEDAVGHRLAERADGQL